MIRLVIICLLGFLSISLSSFGASAQSCSADPVAVQILGSGGPRLNPFRSSSSYLLWLNGKARILVDMGGGAHLRFAQSQAKLEDLWMVGISHLHPDHVSDLPAFLWQSHELRKEPLIIFGPSGNDAAPDFSTFLSRLFDEKTGAFPVLGSTLTACDLARCPDESPYIALKRSFANGPLIYEFTPDFVAWRQRQLKPRARRRSGFE
jgi:hypothetical protein